VDLKSILLFEATVAIWQQWPHTPMLGAA